VEETGRGPAAGFPGGRYRDPILLGLLFVWGTAVCLFYGRLGFMPLDHCAVFDGAWRVLTGQIPFRDFSTPNSLVPIVLQVPFFKALGVNWFSYCLHAALFNGLFCVLVFVFLKWLGGSAGLSFFYALLSGLVLYPPYGLPSHDQHAFFFAFLALVVAVFSSRTASPVAKAVAWFFVPVVLAAAFFSKQVPTIFAVPAVVLVVVATTKKRHLGVLAAAVGASVACLGAGFFAALRIFHVEFAQVKSSLWTFASQMGRERLDFYLTNYSPGKLAKAFFYPLPLEPFTLKPKAFPLIYLSVLVVAGVLMLRALKIVKSKKILRAPATLWAILMSVALLVVCNIFILFTLNQGENGLPYLFAALGLAHIGVLGLFPPRDGKNRVLGPRAAISLIFAIVAVWDGLVFNNQVNRTRIVHDFKLQDRPIAAAADLPPELKFMVFAMPPQYHFSAAGLKRTAEFLRGEKATFFLLGDASVLYALARRPSTSPVLWFHPGLTIPAVDSPDFLKFEDRLLENLRKYKVKYLVLEGDKTWFSLSLGNFRKLASLVREDSPHNRSFGGFRILQLDLAEEP